MKKLVLSLVLFLSVIGVKAQSCDVPDTLIFCDTSYANSILSEYSLGYLNDFYQTTDTSGQSTNPNSIALIGDTTLFIDYCDSLQSIHFKKMPDFVSIYPNNLTISTNRTRPDSTAVLDLGYFLEREYRTSNLVYTVDGSIRITDSNNVYTYQIDTIGGYTSDYSFINTRNGDTLIIEFDMNSPCGKSFNTYLIVDAPEEA